REQIPCSGNYWPPPLAEPDEPLPSGTSGEKTGVDSISTHIAVRARLRRLVTMVPPLGCANSILSGRRHISQIGNRDSQMKMHTQKKTGEGTGDPALSWLGGRRYRSHFTVNAVAVSIP